MHKRALLVSLSGALTGLEKFPGEIFLPDHYDFAGLSLEEFSNHRKNWKHHIKLCVLQFAVTQRSSIDLSMFDRVLVLEQECIDGDPDRYLQFIRRKLQNYNVFIIASGYNSQYTLDKKHIYVLPFFLLDVVRHTHITTINSLQNYKKKFDVLLGMNKPHRDFIYQQIVNHDMLDDCYLNLTTNRFTHKLQTIYRSKDLADVEELSIANNMGSVLDSYAYLEDKGPRISHIVPWSIYNHSLYSIVSETNWCDYLFLSEKTAKALLTQRIFVFFGSAGTLEFIRLLGFRTFDEILDETYDSIQEDQDRFNRAWQQVLALYHAEPYEMYRRCRDIVAHNYKHIQNRDYFIGPLRIWLAGVMTQTH